MARIYVIEKHQNGGSSYYRYDCRKQNGERGDPEEHAISLHKLVKLRKSMLPQHSKLIHIED